MKKLFTFVLIILFSFILFSQVDKKPVFRKAYWGMSKDEVKKIETAKLKTKPEKMTYKSFDDLLFNDIDYDDVNTLVYEEKLFLVPVNLFYSFINDKLYQGRYSYRTSELSDGKSIYELFKTKLTEKYGKPNETSPVSPGSEDYYQSVEWEKPGVKILLYFLGKGTSRIQVLLYYHNPDVNVGKIFEKMEKDKI